MKGFIDASVVRDTYYEQFTLRKNDLFSSLDAVAYSIALPREQMWKQLLISANLSDLLS